MTRYQYVYNDIVTNIYIGKYKFGDCLPTLPELCSIYDIGRNTARSTVCLLHKNGYVELRPKKQPLICFNLNNPQYRAFYLADLSRRKTSITEVYDFIALAIPDMIISILTMIGPKEREQINLLLDDYIQNLACSHEKEMSEALNHLYEVVIAMSGSELLMHLFMSLYHYMQIPLSDDDRSGFVFKYMPSIIKAILKGLKKQFGSQNYNLLKREIQFFTNTVKKSILGYLNRVCKNIPSTPEEHYMWMPWGPAKTQHMTLSARIIENIRNGVYKDGQRLPSYAEMSRQTGLSEKTVRKAVGFLNELKILTSLNGIGTLVNAPQQYSTESFLNNESVRDNIHAFFEAFYILTIFSRSFLLQAASASNRKLTQKLKAERNQSSDFDLTRILEFCIYHTGSLVTQNIYEQLKDILSWGFLLEPFRIPVSDNAQARIDEYILLYESQNGEKLGECFFHTYKKAFEDAKAYVKKQGLEIHLQL